ncbi:hypothetical protein NSTC731_04271 [Nostoc sp. DSM 114167]
MLGYDGWQAYGISKGRCCMNRENGKFYLSPMFSRRLAQYDYILIDCPPSLGILSIMSLVAASHVIIPVETQYKCYLGTNQLLETTT